MSTATKTGAATAVQVQIVGQGTLAGSGLPFVLVTSGSEPGRTHVVSYAYEGAYIGSRMHCDCTGYTYRSHCRHAQLVSDWLAAGLAALGLPYPPQVDETAYGAKSAHGQHLQQSLLNRSQPFQLMK